MKILVVGQVFYPDNFRINDIVKELAVNNDVMMITGLPDYDKGYIPKEYRFFKKRKDMYHNARVVRVPMISRRSGAIFRSLNYVSFMITSSMYTFFLKERFDVVFCYQTSPITMFVPGLVYAKKNKVKSVLYSTDLWPESVKAMNIDESSRIFPILKNMSKKIYNKADQVIVSSPSFIEYLKSIHDLDSTSIEYLPQYTDECKEVIEDKKSNCNKEKTVFTFAGNIGRVQDVDVIIRAAEILKNRNYNFKVKIVGSGSDLPSVKKLSEELNVDDYVEFTGRKSHEEMDEIYDETDVCILTLKDVGYIGKTIPSKLQTYFAKSKPVVAATSGDSKFVIQESRAGVCVESGDVEGLANSMELYIINPGMINKHGQVAKVYYDEHFSREIFFGRLNKYLEA